jgi:hypothetical protein
VKKKWSRNPRKLSTRNVIGQGTSEGMEVLQENENLSGQKITLNQPPYMQHFFF